MTTGEEIKTTKTLNIPDSAFTASRHNTTSTLTPLDTHAELLQQTSTQLTIMFIAFIFVFTSCIVFLCLSRRRAYADDDEDLFPEANTTCKDRWDSCQKNPGHTNLIPVREFRKHHLPLGCQDEELAEFILSVDALTTRITVDYVSTNRPTTMSCSHTPYPFSSKRGGQAARTGSGMVWEVKKITGKDSEELGSCPCGECRRSPTPRKEWGMVQVLTAPHVVFDAEEIVDAKFYVCQNNDNNETTEDCLVGIESIYKFVDNDSILIKCATHDLNLVDKLETLWYKYFKLYMNVSERYKGSQNDKLCVVVSHPHGFTKHVSIGTWSMSEGAGGLTPDTRYTYDTPTCPGSSGSPVFVTGTQWKPINHIHSGSMGMNNLSSVYWG